MASIFVDPNNTTQFLVPAMKNLHSSLIKLNLNSSIKLSSPIALSALQSSYPPSTGSFKSELVQPVIKPMLDFLRQSGSYLMVNAYPFFAYAANADKISLDYALFRTNSGNVDSGNGLRYYSLFEAQLDAVFAAMSALGYDNVKVAVTETGWPSKGDENEVGAGQQNAASYNGNLVRRVLTGSGTPLRPNEPLDVYLFALFNENQKPGPTSERNYGLFYPNEQKVYDIPLTAAEINGKETTPVNGSKEQVPATSDVSTAAAGTTWCVANEEAGDEKLQAALDYACGEGGADCRPIQEGSTCYNPDSLVAHASYAFNSYYQKKARGTGTCNFGGSAYVVTQPPNMESENVFDIYCAPEAPGSRKKASMWHQGESSKAPPAQKYRTTDPPADVPSTNATRPPSPLERQSPPAPVGLTPSPPAPADQTQQATPTSTGGDISSRALRSAKDRMAKFLKHERC